MPMLDRLRSIFRTPTATPSPGVPRVQARAPVYESGSRRGPRGVEWSTPDPSANVATASVPTIRARCRDAYRNDAWFKAIVETFVDDVIGWGVKPLSRATSEIFRQAVQRLWEDWAAVADADGLVDMAGLQALALRTMVVDGECFIRLRPRKPEDGLPVRLQLQVLPPEICPAEYTTRAPNGNEIREGIELDAIGRRVAYWFRDAVPGEDTLTASSANLHAVPADSVLHLFEPLRPGQRRGVPMLAPAIVRLRELDKYTDATLLRLQISSMFVGTVKPGMPTTDAVDTLTGEVVSETAPDKPMLRLVPGTLQELDPGDSLEFNKPPDPPVGFTDFVRHELRAAGAAVGVPFECFSHDWTGQNDRIARITLNQYRRRVHRLLWSIVVPQFLQPVWRTWFDLALSGMKLPVDPKTIDDDRLGRVTWAPHAHAYVHPVQDVASYREAIKSGLTSRAAAVAETGEDVEVIDAQQAADNARSEKLGLRYDSDVRQGGAL